MDREEVWAPASKKRLSETVAERISEAILSGVLRPGDRIVETEIAERLSVSKSPVREALRDLERQGLVTLTPRHGCVVRVITAEDAREIRELRVVLETFAVRAALSASGPEWIAELDAAVARMGKAHDRAELNREHLVFHDVVLSRSGNQRVVDILQRLRSQIEILFAFIDLLYESPTAVADDHAVFVDALRTGDVATAEAAVDEHIRLASERLEALWAHDNPQPPSTAVHQPNQGSDD